VGFFLFVSNSLPPVDINHTRIRKRRAVYSHTIKIEDTAEGIRLSVHVCANDTGQAIEQAFSMYLKAQQTARDNKITLAPTEVNGK
jgi:flagellar capping protein FliD